MAPNEIFFSISRNREQIFTELWYRYVAYSFRVLAEKCEIQTPLSPSAPRGRTGSVSGRFQLHTLWTNSPFEVSLLFRILLLGVGIFVPNFSCYSWPPSVYCSEYLETNNLDSDLSGSEVFSRKRYILFLQSFQE